MSIYSAKAAKSEAPRTAARDPTTPRPTEAPRAAAPGVAEAEAWVPVPDLVADLEFEALVAADLDAELLAAGPLV
jgi:hypothetical protein